MKYGITLSPQAKIPRDPNLTVRMRRAAPAETIIETETVTETVTEPATPITILLDNFFGSGSVEDHTSDSGHSWTYSPNLFFEGWNPGSLVLADGRVSSETGTAVVSNAEIPNDCWLEAHIRVPDEDPYIVLAFRYTESTGAGYFLVVQAGTDPSTVSLNLQFWQGEEGSSGTILDTTDVSVESESNFVVRIEIEGSDIRLYTDGVFRETVTSTDVTEGETVGFAIDDDDAQIETLSAGNL